MNMLFSIILYLGEVLGTYCISILGDCAEKPIDIVPLALAPSNSTVFIPELADRANTVNTETIDHPLIKPAICGRTDR